MRRRGWLGSSLAALGRLEHRLTMDLLMYGSGFVRVFSDGRSARVAPQVMSLFKGDVARANEAGELVDAETGKSYAGVSYTGEWWFE